MKIHGKFELFGCPIHLGVSNVGIIPCIDTLNTRYTDLKIKKLDEVVVAEDDIPNLKNLGSVVATCSSIAVEASEIVMRGNTPLFIGGDHSGAIGTISGVAKHKTSLGLFWIDSHSDINTDITTLTGNIHGMPVSAVMGFGNEQLISVMFDGTKVLPQNVVMFGLRDVDPLEEKIIERLDIKCYTYDQIVARGLEVCLAEVNDYFKKVKNVHISFDLDSMNPDIIKGVSVPVASGFTVDDVDIITDYVMDNFSISSMDIVEYNPIADTDGFTGEFANGLIKKIIDNK